MPTPFDQDEYPSSPPTAPSWTVPLHAPTDPGWPTAELTPAPGAPDGGAAKPSLSRMAVAAVVITALLLGSAVGGLASWFAFARSDGTISEARAGVVQPEVGSSQGSAPSDSSSEALGGWDEVSAAINPGVVDIETQMTGGTGAGTGMILSADGLVLTNNHVVEGARAIVVTVTTTGESYRASIVGTDPDEDVAVVQIEGASDLTPIPMGDSESVAVGDRIAAIGNAGGAGGTPNIAAGRVTALGQQITATAEDGSDAQTLQDMIQVSANVVPGDSGGPLADDSGKVVGMTTAASVANGTGRLRSFGGTSTDVGYAIPIDRALQIAEQLKSSGGSGNSGSSSTASGGYLGVQVSAGATDGVDVAGVMSGSPAASAGIEVGDTIVAIDDDRVNAPDELVDVLSQHSAGDEVVVTWFGSDGEANQATVTLAER